MSTLLKALKSCFDWDSMGERVLCHTYNALPAGPHPETHNNFIVEHSTKLLSVKEPFIIEIIVAYGIL